MKPLFRQWFDWGFGVWLGLAVIAFGLTRDLERDLWFWTLMVIGPALAVIGILEILREGHPRARVLRVAWWVVTLAGCGLVGILFQSQWESMANEPSKVLLAVYLVAHALVFFGVWLHARRAGKSRRVCSWLPDAALALACLVLLGIGGVWALNVQIAKLEHRGLKRWAAIGRPMPQFEKGIHRVDENRDLNELLHDLQPLGVTSLYKATDAEPSLGTLVEPPEVMLALFTAPGACADRVELAADATPYLDAHAEQLAGIYDGILHREPAVWGFDPADGQALRVPNFLAARMCSQIFCADALRRLSRGDIDGAARAVRAGLRMSEKLCDQPLLVSLMVRVAVEGLFAKAEARLPLELGAWEHIAADAERVREAFRQALQFEACTLSRLARGELKQQFVPGEFRFCEAMVGFKVPNWVERITWRPLFRLDAARASLCHAKAVRIIMSAEALRTDDLGEAQWEASCRQHPSALAVNCVRAWSRLQGTLLLREQVDLIRRARAHLQTGRADGLVDLASNVIPGAIWTTTLDSTAQTVALKLENAPRWADHSSVFGADFYLLPLDGSRAWQFESAPVTRTAAAQNPMARRAEVAEGNSGGRRVGEPTEISLLARDRPPFSPPPPRW